MFQDFVTKLLYNISRVPTWNINQYEICQWTVKDKKYFKNPNEALNKLFYRSIIVQQNVGITPHYQIRNYFEKCWVKSWQSTKAFLFRYLSILQSWANSSIFMLTYGQRVIFKVQPSWKSESRTVCLPNYFSSSQGIRGHNFHLHALPHILHTILYNDISP